MNRIIIKQFIDNINSKVCSKCVYFLNKNGNYYCKKFGEKNIITGEIIYNTCKYQRSDMCSINCGPQGRHYETTEYLPVISGKTN
jgi:hypothetical protein